MDPNWIAAISAAGAVLSAVTTGLAVFVAYKVHQNQKLLAQRQLLLPLWEHMASLSKINPDEPVIPDVIKVVNTLELVALCCEGGMVDEQIIRRTFKDQFLMHFESVKKCPAMKGMGDGESLLKQNRAAEQFYDALERERKSYDSVRSV